MSRSRFTLGSTMALMTGRERRVRPVENAFACPRSVPHPPSSCFCTRRSSFRMELISWKDREEVGYSKDMWWPFTLLMDLE